MPTSTTPFRRSVDEQIALNRARTPTQRFEALCDLLDFARSMAPSDADARERRRRALAARQHEREQWREESRDSRLSGVKSRESIQPLPALQLMRVTRETARALFASPF